MQKIKKRTPVLEYMKKKRVNQAELASLMGLAQPSVSRMLRRNRGKLIVAEFDGGLIELHEELVRVVGSTARAEGKGVKK